MKKISRIAAIVASAGALAVVDPTVLIGNGMWWL